MADFWTIIKLSRVVDPECLLYNSNWIVGPIAIAIDFYPYYLSMVLWSLTMFQYELFTALLSAALTIDFLLNLLFSAAQSPGMFAGCGSTHETPSFATQHIFVFTIVILSLINKWNLEISPFKILFIQLFHSLVVASRIYIGINTAEQLFLGALVGAIEGIIFQIIIHYVFFHKQKLLKTYIFRKLGIQDNLSKNSYIWFTKK